LGQAEDVSGDKLWPKWYQSKTICGPKYYGLVHRLVFKTHKNIKTYLSRQQFRGKY
jgi:hypothetical protein